ncbi:phytanoyl-CoA dioxygenase family protein [bacterium AH-315-E10]|nr:phytanoyl-CoA dioxygenase family protein [bacterium AH-315-E10]
MDIHQALNELGADANLLPQQNRDELDNNGFTFLYDMLTDLQLDALRSKFEELCKQEGKSAGLEVHQEEGTRRLSDLCNKGDIFESIYTHPRMLAAMAHVLKGEFHISSLNARDAMPGEGNQGLHADGPPAKAIGEYIVCNSIWLLDEFTSENGCTRLIPGSHRFLRNPGDDMKDPSQPHPDEVYVIAPAGTVGIFNSHIWHGGTKNVTEDKKRLAIHCYFTTRDQPQQLDQKEYIRVKTWKRLSPAARYLLNVDLEL